MAMTGTMEINADPVNGGCLLVIAGEIDLANVNIFIERLFELSANGDQKIVLDLTDVEFVDSTVLNALFAAAPRIRSNGGDMAIVLVNPSVTRVVEIAGLDVLYRVVRTRKAAFERLGLTPE
jgi:anti-sigma B factor antagonist